MIKGVAIFAALLILAACASQPTDPKAAKIAAAHAKAQHAQLVKEHREAAARNAAALGAEKNAVAAVLKTMNSSDSGQVFTSYSVSNDSIHIVADADVWDNISGQDQDMSLQLIEKAYVIAYRRNHGGKIDHDVSVAIDDLAGNRLKSDMIYPDN